MRLHQLLSTFIEKAAKVFKDQCLLRLAKVFNDKKTAKQLCKQLCIFSSQLCTFSLNLRCFNHPATA